MIDFQPQIFTYIESKMREAYPDVLVTGELSDQIPQFPCVQIDEQSNIPTQLDNGKESQYARIQYRIRIYTNRESGRKTQAREILAYLDSVLEGINLIRKTYATQSGLYTNSAYCIDMTYEAAIDSNGVIYRR